MKINNLSKLQKVSVILGMFFIALSLLTVLGVLLGLIEINTFEFFGHSGIRSIAALGVLGCILAAIGYYDE